eukprot:g1362.t1
MPPLKLRFHIGGEKTLFIQVRSQLLENCNGSWKKCAKDIAIKACDDVSSTLNMEINCLSTIEPLIEEYLIQQSALNSFHRARRGLPEGAHGFEFCHKLDTTNNFCFIDSNLEYSSEDMNNLEMLLKEKESSEDIFPVIFEYPFRLWQNSTNFKASKFHQQNVGITVFESCEESHTSNAVCLGKNGEDFFTEFQLPIFGKTKIDNNIEESEGSVRDELLKRHVSGGTEINFEATLGAVISVFYGSYGPFQLDKEKKNWLLYNEDVRKTLNNVRENLNNLQSEIMKKHFHEKELLNFPQRNRPSWWSSSDRFMKEIGNGENEKVKKESSIPKNLPEEIARLYKNFKNDLLRVRKEARLYCNKLRKHAMINNYENNYDGVVSTLKHDVCLLTDVEAEVTYLRLRHLKPKKILEVSPYRGWSTFWILSALRDNILNDKMNNNNNNEAEIIVPTLSSFDLVDYSKILIPKTLYQNKENENVNLPIWKLQKGNVQIILNKDIPREDIQFDYLFIDSRHDYEFGRWYTDVILLRQNVSQKQVSGSIHDAYYSAEVNDEIKEPFEYFSSLATLGAYGRTFTVAANKEPLFHARIQAIRRLMGIVENEEGRRIWRANGASSMLFFDSKPITSQ